MKGWSICPTLSTTERKSSSSLGFIPADGNFVGIAYGSALRYAHSNLKVVYLQKALQRFQARLQSSKTERTLKREEIR